MSAAVGAKQYHETVVDSLVEVVQDSQSLHVDSEYVIYSILNPALQRVMHTRYIFQTATDFSFKWMDAQARYMDSLSRTDKFIVRAYTRHGDEIVNNYLRLGREAFFTNNKMSELLFDKMIKEDTLVYAVQLFNKRSAEGRMDESVNDCFYSDGTISNIGSDYITRFAAETSIEEIDELIREYILDLRMIIANAPPVTAPTLVFRGVRNDYLSKANVIAMQQGFTSTSLDPDIASGFAADANMMYEMILLPGTRCIMPGIYSNFPIENEIILDNETYVNPTNMLGKYMLNVRSGVGKFPAEHFWNPMTAPIQTRTVFTAGDLPVTSGGFVKSATKRGSTRRGKSAAAKAAAFVSKKLKTGKSRRATRRSKKPAMKPVRTYPDPLIRYDVPIPANVRSALEAAMASYVKR